jgi:hypothetical protein
MFAAVACRSTAALFVYSAMMRLQRRNERTGAMPNNVHIAARHTLRLVLIAACAIALGACSKCDVPNWLPGHSPAPPASCHDGPSPQR